MESPAVAPNLLKYLFLGALYLFILALFWAMWRQTRGPGRAQGDGRKATQKQEPTRPDAPILVIESGVLDGRRLVIEHQLTIGRSPDNDIVLPDRFVSSRHATVRREGDETWLVDEGSTNGTFLNGFRIDGTSILRPGDTFVIADTTFRLVQE